MEVVLWGVLIATGLVVATATHLRFASKSGFAEGVLLRRVAVATAVVAPLPGLVVLATGVGSLSQSTWVLADFFASLVIVLWVGVAAQRYVEQRSVEPPDPTGMAFVGEVFAAIGQELDRRGVRATRTGTLDEPDQTWWIDCEKGPRALLVSCEVDREVTVLAAVRRGASPEDPSAKHFIMIPDDEGFSQSWRLQLHLMRDLNGWGRRVLYLVRGLRWEHRLYISIARSQRQRFLAEVVPRIVAFAAE